MTAPRTRFDAIIIGSGINSLVCAALLAKRGKSVCVLERETVAGGCIRSEELTLPGFVHDTLSTLYPLFVTAPHFPVLSSDLEAAGARFVNIATPTAVVLPDGRSLRFSRDRRANIAAFDALAPGDGMAYSRAMEAIETSAALTFGLLGAELWRFKTLRLLLREWRRLGARGLLEFFGRALGSCRDWLEADFQSDLCRALFAPWILHVGLAPEASLSGHMGRLILFTLEQAGSPMVQGGSARLVEAFTKIIELHGGEIRTGTAVARVVTRRGRACGVVTEGGSRLDGRSVVANVGPRQLYRELLEGEALPKRVVADADGFRYGRGEMQIHLALNAVPQWPDPALTQVGMLHLTAGLAGVSRAVNEAERGLLPADATIVVAQPVAIDPSRAPAGSWIFWIQLQELPRDGQLRGDARGEIATDADGRWTERIRDAYADRIVGRLCALIPNLRASIVGRRVISPADLAAMNVNLVGGDPYGGSCALDQFMMWRPFGAVRNHATPIAGLFHIGASTHPGPGLGGLSGYMAAAAIR